MSEFDKNLIRTIAIIAILTMALLFIVPRIHPAYAGGGTRYTESTELVLPEIPGYNPSLHNRVTYDYIRVDGRPYIIFYLDGDLEVVPSF